MLTPDISLINELQAQKQKLGNSSSFAYKQIFKKLTSQLSYIFHQDIFLNEELTQTSFFGM